MEAETTVFAIPIFRLRDVAETIEAYDANFWRNRHAVKLMVYQRDDLTIKFHYEGEVTLQDSEEILARVCAVHGRVLAAARDAAGEERRQALCLFADSLSKAFYGFEPDFFQQNVSRIVDDVISQIHASLELWPTLVEVCYYCKDKKPLPQTRVKNKRLASPR